MKIKMDRKLAVAGATINLAGVIAFAGTMLTGSLSASYISSIFIAWGLVIMNSGFFRFGRADARVAALCAVVFAGMYAVCNSVVYFVQITTVANDALSAQAMSVLDYRSFGLMFNLDMLGYCLMAVSTFFAGLTIAVRDKGDRCLKVLLLIHGIFAVSCFLLPMLGLFHAGMEGADRIGTAVLEFWCVYFIPVGILSIRYFRHQVSGNAKRYSNKKNAIQS